MEDGCLLRRVFGLRGALETLRKALTRGEAGGSYLFVGPEGVGKTTLAEAFGAVLACTGRPPNSTSMCGKCSSCRLALGGVHPEIRRIDPAGDQTQIWQFWDRPGRPEGVLQRALAFAPAAGAQRVFIVTRADTLTSAAANSLLKALEEPPPYATLVLLAPNTARLLPTLLSRCRIVRCLPEARETLANYLVKAHGAGARTAEELAALCEGRTGEAIRLLADPGQFDLLRAVAKLALELPGAGLVRALQASETLRKAGAAKSAPETAQEASGGEPQKDRAARGQLGGVLDRLLAVYRDLLHASLAGEEACLFHRAFENDLRRVGRSRPPARWMRDIETIMKARERLERNASLGLLTDWLAAELAA